MSKELSEYVKEKCETVKQLINKYQEELNSVKYITYSNYYISQPINVELPHIVAVKLNDGQCYTGIIETYYYNSHTDSLSDWVMITEDTQITIDIQRIVQYRFFYIGDLTKEKIIEKWECVGCAGKEYPCKIEIHSADSELPATLRGKTKFRRRLCICDNMLYADWKQITDKDDEE